VIYLGDLFVVLRTVAADSIDACVTDPPYGLGFMGKEWDTFRPGAGKHRRLMHPRERALGKIESDNPNINGRWRSPALSPSQIDYDYSPDGLRAFQHWTYDWATAVWRVMKPGAYLVVHGAPRSHHRMMCGLEDAGFVVRDCLAWLFGSGFPKSLNLGDGRGTALKPAHEPIALAWKPIDGSIAENLAEYGTGALNIDACRIESLPYDAPGDRGQTDRTRRLGFALTPGKQADLGRWPANVLLDEEAAEMLDAQTGELTSGARAAGVRKGLGYHGANGDGGPAIEANAGGASRFYYVAKPSRRERDRGCADLVAATGGEATDRKDGSAGLQNPRAGAGRTGGAKNIHPTVKPVELMRWLVRLVTPPGGTVLDPFCGSGTTGMACRFEGREFIGIEREAQYVEIARHRIASVKMRRPRVKALRA